MPKAKGKGKSAKVSAKPEIPEGSKASSAPKTSPEAGKDTNAREEPKTSPAAPKKTPKARKDSKAPEGPKASPATPKTPPKVEKDPKTPEDLKTPEDPKTSPKAAKDPKVRKNAKGPEDPRVPEGWKAEPCGHHAEFTHLPPSFQTLIQVYPHIIANKRLDRSIPRCKLCDLIAAQAGADEAEYPPPTFKNPADELEKHIKLTEELIAEGVRKEEMQELLLGLKKKLSEANRDTDARIIQAWKEYWGIWGATEGPDRPEELVVEEPGNEKAKEKEELEIDFNIPEETVEEPTEKKVAKRSLGPDSNVSVEEPVEEPVKKKAKRKVS